MYRNTYSKLVFSENFGCYMGFRFHKLLLQVTRVGVLLSVTTSASAVLSYPSSLPNCQNCCGGVEIPYPFGMNQGCYLDESFGFNWINTYLTQLIIEWVWTLFKSVGLDEQMCLGWFCHPYKRPRHGFRKCHQFMWF